MRDIPVFDTGVCMPGIWDTLAEDLKETDFLRKFLELYIRNGYGSLPKRETELALLDLMIKFRQEWRDAPPNAFQLARGLRISQSRARSLLDEIAYRDETKTDDWCREELRAALLKAEKVKSDSWVQLQLDDGLVRDFAVAEVRKGYGIVDTSFNSAIIKLSGEKFAALVLESMPAVEANRVIANISEEDREQQQNDQGTKGSIRLFVDAFAESAGQQAGKKAVNLGFALLTGGADLAIELINSEIVGG
jgi:hypothetical protein